MNSSEPSKHPIIAVVGPTASGKSALGIELALRTSGEIINCDSVQVYQGIEIATAKVSLAERRGVPHHLIDFVPPEINYTAGDWARDAARKVEEIEARGVAALLVGGTGFYLRALRQPFFPGPPTDETLRKRLTNLREQRGLEHLHRMLSRVDQLSAGKLHVRDWPRVQRALEVRFQTGRPISAQLRERMEPSPSAARIQVVALAPPRAELYERINRRAEGHFAAGLVEEVRYLLDQGVPAESNALGSHGYRRVVEYLRGQRDLRGAIEQTKMDVRHYAKRQLTWFRREPGVHWFAGFGEDPLVQESVFSYVKEIWGES
ncbi:MAG TPA: tRNA (adenosine(37)-N6)-dimethylallyltransferase MiaA [Pyrinomonadaceae bacterium]|nr:tRNA (adenosine(37)-N6)-dimethylallyltransferase MiaA [Pyrinomonadaceae bacterium]